MSEHWYRNRRWGADVEAAFEARIARARGQKAQYLMIQGQALIEHHPDVAVRLLRRSIALDDQFHLNQANCYLATAQLALGEIDASLKSYEAALEAQLRLPNFRTSAALDYCFVVAYFRRTDRYVAALPILEAVRPSYIQGADFQALAAHALILGDLGRGDEARAKAAAALSAFPSDADGASWAGVSVDDLKRRLADLAAPLRS